MKVTLSVLAVAAMSVTAQALTTIEAPCGTACQPAPTGYSTIYRSVYSSSEATPCPSLIVSSIAQNGSNPMAATATPTATAGAGAGTGSKSGSTFTGGAVHAVDPMNIAILAVGLAAGAFAL